tara:strand:+ start:393 stop:4226 length:3834 start_codon:yes stop_codon:yes gene_type:complete
VATEESKSKTAYYEGLDLGALNRLNRDVTASRLNTSAGAVSILGTIFDEVYKYDIKKGSGPYAAVVLEVLTGPQVGNEASTGGALNSKSLSLPGHGSPSAESRKKAGKPPPVTVIAKIPEFDADIGWPEDDKDKARIDAHGEFVQISEELEHVNKIEVGSVIWIQYANDEAQASYDGKPTGLIIGVHTVEAHAEILTRISAKRAQAPECQAARNLGAPEGGFYVGHTDDNPVPTVPSIKIKGHIKTGFFGGGHPRTKVHFDSALAEAPISPLHQIKGPAPGSNNAFIWIGTLKNNGYMDLLDRPIGQGRETIIYAPMTLDLNAPFEIKYYLHGAGGFGSAHIDGPTMPLEQAEYSAKMNGNDFKEKIAPAIKDLNRDGRNYVLVIPEMSYSRGFGTANDDTNRVDLLIEGENIGTGVPPGNTAKTTVRTATTPKIRGLLKNYLSTIPVEADKNLVQNIPLRERQLSTFDGSYTGGNFGLFHDEVIDVLDEHLYRANLIGGGTTSEKLEFVSFVADGLGGIALASIVKNVPNSATHADALVNFKNYIINLERPLRIDYITDSTLDSNPNFYSSFFGNESPSTVIADNLLAVRDQGFYTEFNYITSPAITDTNSFFDKLGKLEDYKKHSKTAGGLGSNKFSFLLGNSLEDQRFISLHVSSKNRVGYAFSMVNDFLSSFKAYPKKPNENANLRPSFNAVPDHAYALVTKPSPGDLEKLVKLEEDLIPRIEYFADLITSLESPGPPFRAGAGFATVCQDVSEGKPSPYKMYCKDGIIDTRDESTFNKDYRLHLQNLKKLGEIQILKDGETTIQPSLRSIKQLRSLEKDYTKLYTTAKEIVNDVDDGESLKDVWNLLNTTFFEYEQRSNSAGMPFDIQLVARIAVAPEAYKKIITKIESAIKTSQPQTAEKSADCAASPVPLGSTTGISAPARTTDVPGSNCASIKSLLNTTPTTAATILKIIGYEDDLIDDPKKSDFKPYKGRSSNKKTNVHLLDAFKTSTFQYLARGLNNGKTTKESPPVWACISDILSQGWSDACEASKYYPFAITSGIKASDGEFKTAGNVAYTSGLSLHAFGLAIDVDPQITGCAKRKDKKSLYSVYTGAWTPDFIETDKGLELWKLGVYKVVPSILKNNAYEKDNRRRLVENFEKAPHSYLKKGDDNDFKPRDRRYFDIMNEAKGGPIVPPGANPTLWMILFCEKTGMKWGNANFLKKRHKGGQTWNDAEKETISKLFDIPDIVNRVQAISWNGKHDNHMHFQFWAGQSGLVTWKELEGASNADDL